MSVKGYITPSGQITIKKCWRYDEDKEIKINMRSFNNAFKRFLEKEKKPEDLQWVKHNIKKF